MSILVRFSPPSMTAEQYDAIVERLYKEGVHPDPGLELDFRFERTFSMSQRQDESTSKSCSHMAKGNLIMH